MDANQTLGVRQLAALKVLRAATDGIDNMQRPLGIVLRRGPYLPCAETQAVMGSLLRRGLARRDGLLYHITHAGMEALMSQETAGRPADSRQSLVADPENGR